MAGRKGDVLGSSQSELETTFRNLRVSDQQQTTTNPTHAKYNPVVSTDLLIQGGASQSYNTKCHCITRMKEYEDKSLEELRLEDYTAGRKGGAAGKILKEDASNTSAPAFYFGIPASETNAPACKFGIATSNTNALTFSFGTSIFSSITPASGTTAGSSDQQNTATNAKYNPVVGTDVDTRSKPYKTKSHCITLMKEYEDKSLEELRLEDYTAGRKGGAAGGADHQNTATNTTNVKYNPVVGTEVDIRSKLCKTKSHCITVMKQYEEKSLEELRLEDYTAGRKGGAADESLKEVEEASNTSTLTFGIPTSNNSTPTFGIPSSNTSVPTFGIPAANPSASTISFGVGATNISAPNFSFGSSDEQNTATNAKYNPVVGTDVDTRSKPYKTKSQCITVMKEYEDKSLEELRLEDYTAGRKGGVAAQRTTSTTSNTPGTSASASGTRTPVSGTRTPASGTRTPASGTRSPASGTRTPASSSSSSDGSSDEQNTATNAKYNPVVGTDVDRLSRPCETKSHCITLMKEYEDKSLEELRLEDYAAGRKGGVAVRSGQKQSTTDTASSPSNTDSRCSTSEEETRRAKDPTASKKIPKEEKPKRTLGSCPLCFDDYSDGQPIASTTCGHVFCRDCLKRALDVESKCPTCRTRLSGTSKYHAIYL